METNLSSSCLSSAGLNQKTRLNIFQGGGLFNKSEKNKAEDEQDLFSNLKHAFKFAKG
jgi:hypothetical protein